MRIINGLGWVEILAPSSWIVLDIDTRDVLRKTVDAHRSSQEAMDGLRTLCTAGQGPGMTDEDVAQKVTAGLLAGDICVDAAHWFACSFATFPTVNSAKLFVQSIQREPGVTAFLRHVVARHRFSPAPISDDQVVDQMAALIFQGALRVRTGRFVWNSCLPEAKPEEAPPPPKILAPPPPPKPAEAETPSTFDYNADLALIAATMREAAQLGVPFCEECQRQQ